MTEVPRDSVPNEDSHPELTVLGGKEERPATERERMSPEAQAYIGRSLGQEPAELVWLKRDNAAAFIALFDAIMSRFVQQGGGLHEREIARLELFLANSASDEEISEQTKAQFGADMDADDVRLEREDITQILHMGLQKPALSAMIHTALAVMRMENESEALDAAPTDDGTPATESATPAPQRRPARQPRRTSPAKRAAPKSDEESDNDAGEARNETELGDRDLVGQYLAEIAKTPLLKAEQEVELSKIIEAGLFAGKLLEARADGTSTDPEITQKIMKKYAAVSDDELTQIAEEGQAAYNRFLKSNLRLAVNIAKKYGRNNGVPMLDNIQEGNMGLIRAVEKFDYTKGFKFSTYGTWWVRQAISRGAVENARLVRLPMHRMEQINKFNNTRRILRSNLQREPTFDEIGETMGLGREKLLELMHDARHPASFNAKLGDDELELGDIIVSDESTALEETVVQGMLRKEFDAVLDTLNERERDVIMRRHGLVGGGSETLDSIANKWGVTRERIRQIERKTMEKLKGSKHLEAFFQEYKEE